eukprot:scaffold2214_cov139-Cylindrotheca_fusiformis.AAC.32
MHTYVSCAFCLCNSDPCCFQIEHKNIPSILAPAVLNERRWCPDNTPIAPMNNYNTQNLGFDPSGQAFFDETTAGYYGNPDQMIYSRGAQGVYQQDGTAAGMYPPPYSNNVYVQNQYDFSQQGWNPQQQANIAEPSISPGSYYFHSEFTPQLFGFPVTSLAYDASYDAMYVASATQAMTTTRWKAHRASMLAIHSTTNGMCYSSVGGHPEAPMSVLNSVYESIYGIAKTVPVAPGRQHIPPHAYKPPYGGSLVDTVAPSGGAGKKQGHMGITDILPLKNDGHAATISPSAVRIHSHGGLQVHDHSIEGMLCGTVHPHSGGLPTHISVGGLTSGDKYSRHDIFCMDIWQGLRVVNSYAINKRATTTAPKACVTAMATSQERGTIVAGCTDGNIRILDGSLREMAKIKSHNGGISNMSVSSDGMLVATTGYSSRVPSGKETSILYGFPDTRIYIYDMRYLGRGGIPHMFAGVRGCPRHVSFVPDVENLPSNRLLVASGQPGGGLQILVPFEEPAESNTAFFAPQLAQGESISAMGTSEDDLALGTSGGRVLRYRLAGYKPKTKFASPNSSAFVPSTGIRSSARGSRRSRLETTNRKPLEMSKLYEQPIPPLSMDPKLLLSNGDPGMRNGNDERIKALFSTYTLQADPQVSSIGYTVENTVASFGSLGGKPIILGGRRRVSEAFLNEAATGEEDFLVTIPTDRLKVDILANHAPQLKRRPYNKKAPKKETKPNPNKFLFCPALSSLCYEDGLNGRRRQRGNQAQGSRQNIPARYRLQVRPHFRKAGAFDPADYNDTGLFPGWDYPSTLPNAFATPVLLLLYFVPEIRSAVLAAQLLDMVGSARPFEKSLSPELGFVFHQIESLSSFALLHPVQPNGNATRPRIGAWFPSNFLTTLATMSEAEQLQILDGSPAAVDPPRRPEAFYRFMAYQLDKELSKNTETKLMDSLHGLDFLSINQFVSESSLSGQSTTRALTVDLAYDSFSSNSTKKTHIRFGTLLQHSLCRETRLRAWNKKSKAYETIVQRKIATSLPAILTLSGACAGRKEEDGLWLWRTDDGSGPWVPEMVEVELLEDGNVSVKEMKFSSEGEVEEVWASTEPSKLPASVSKLVSEASSKQKTCYRLDAVLSYVNDQIEDAEETELPGHHVLHARIPPKYKEWVLKAQQQEVQKRIENDPKLSKMVLSASVTTETFQKRAATVEMRLKSSAPQHSEWVLFNGFSAKNTVTEDARAFHVPFKEPCLFVYRAMSDIQKEESALVMEASQISIPAQVLDSGSLSSATEKKSSSYDPSRLEEGKIIAFDAEFVSVEEEEAAITDSGSKVILRETRHAIARISVIDCDSREIILDDHVLPKERVADYLTRFSGIVAEDLDPDKSPHNLISTRSAYLKLRYLMEQGCIFLGHGLRKDFVNVNLVVPPHQIIDTVEIFHQPGMRYISLRFLVNYVLKRDMQQDIHDSVEDALAAFELYEKALEWKREGAFDRRLQEIYTYGSQTDWKLGMDKVSKSKS